MDCPQGSIKVYDLAFDNQPSSVLKAVTKAFVAPEQIVQISVMNTEMQRGPNDCGVYVFAMMTSIAYGVILVITPRQCDVTLHNVLKCKN